jgi:hypothetical protein
VELKAEVAMFDEIREQRRVTDENKGSSLLCKLIAQASNLNMPRKKSRR